MTEEKTATGTPEAPAVAQPPDDFESYQKFRDAGDVLAEPEEETPAAAAEKTVAKTAPASEPEEEEQEAEAAAEPAAEDDAAPKKKGGYQRKIGKLERENEALQSRVAALEGRPAANAAAPAEKAAAKADALKPDDFPDYEEYVAAKAAAVVEETLAARDAKAAAAETRREAAEAERESATRWNAAREAHEDFDEVLDAVNDVVFAPQTRDAIHSVLHSPGGPELAYELAKNRPEAVRIAAITDGVTALLELGKFAASVAKAAEKPPPEPKPKAQLTRAPKPVTPLSAGSGSATTPDVYDEKFAGEDYNAWETARRAQLKR